MCEWLRLVNKLDRCELINEVYSLVVRIIHYSFIRTSLTHWFSKQYLREVTKVSSNHIAAVWRLYPKFWPYLLSH